MATEIKPVDPSAKYIPELDGVRALTIGAVFLHHISTHWRSCLGPFAQAAVFGWVGVDVFFLLSGFLITAILLRAKPGLQALKDFYVKRALRIWPLYYVLLGLMCLEILVYRKSYPVGLSVIFLQNFLPSWPALGTFNQTWSLCVEEHFYLLWPLAVFFLPRRILPGVLVAVLCLSPVLRWYAIDHGIAPKLLYTASPFRFDSIALGSLIAFFTTKGTLSLNMMRRVGPAAAILGASLVTWIFLHQDEWGQLSVFVYSWLALASGGILLIALAFRNGAVGAFLRWSPLRYIGKISYGLYMLHPFVFGYIALKMKGSAGLAVALLISFVAAMSSWHFMETPILRLKNRLTGTHRNPRGTVSIAANVENTLAVR
ncbi:MAG TPA: acyltransferase [Bryobacteraceae bacterium]|jgi:peptidoglycan/LPS O-acetylase OafA/YrhL|nr:acyltransferase [Bryobacteraceae bacterium]